MYKKRRILNIVRRPRRRTKKKLKTLLRYESFSNQSKLDLVKMNLIKLVLPWQSLKKQLKVFLESVVEIREKGTAKFGIII